MQAVPLGRFDVVLRQPSYQPPERKMAILFGVQDFTLFLVAGITLNLMPGPDTLYIIGRSLAQGRRAGLVSVLGISSGCLIHTTAAAFGLSAILVSSATAFSLVKWAGAAYLIFLGMQMFRPAQPALQDDLHPAASVDLRTVYRQGLTTNVLNPKVALFFMAFLPQFVAPDRATSPLPFLFLGGVFIGTGTLWCLVLATTASTLSRSLRAQSGSLLLLRRITGTVFVALGLRLAFQQVR